MKFFYEIKRHLLDIKKRGLNEFFRKSKNFLLRFLNFFLIIFFAIPILLLSIIISPVILFRFGILRSSRVGHFTSNTEIYLCRKKLKLDTKKLNYDFISFDSVGVSNSFLKKNYKREINIFPNVIIQPFYDLLSYLNGKIKFTKKFEINVLKGLGDRDLDGLLYKINHSIKFDKHDISKIEKELQYFGLDLSSKFICLDVRDESYLKNTYPLGNWDYHKPRDWEINRFVKASENLAKRGYKILRMGKIVNEKMISSNPMIIDYANSNFRSDLLDVYLHTKSYLTVTTGTGIESGSVVSRRPIAFLLLPIGYFYTYYKYNFFSTKHHTFIHNKKKLTLSEIFEAGLAEDVTKIGKDKNIILEQLNENEINDYLLQVLDILEGNFSWSEDEKNQQLEFWNKYKLLIDKYKLSHLHKNYNAIFSPIHLKNNPHLLK